MQSIRHQLPRTARAFSTSAARPLAKMQIIGRLAATPELQSTSVGKDLVKYALAVSHGPKDENGNRSTSWYKVASFQDGPLRDIQLSLPKGTQVYVEAEARMDTYETGTGEKRTSLNLLQRNFEILSRPQNASTEAAEPLEEPARAAQ